MLAISERPLPIGALCVVDCPPGETPKAHQEGARPPTHKVIRSEVAIYYGEPKSIVEVEELPKPNTHVEHAFELLARSDQWETFLGGEETTNDIDDLIISGDLHDAAGQVVWVCRDHLDDGLAKVAVESRARFLEGKSGVDEAFVRENTVTISAVMKADSVTDIHKMLDQLHDFQICLENLLLTIDRGG